MDTTIPTRRWLRVSAFHAAASWILVAKLGDFLKPVFGLFTRINPLCYKGFGGDFLPAVLSPLGNITDQSI